MIKLTFSPSWSPDYGVRAGRLVGRLLLRSRWEMRACSRRMTMKIMKEIGLRMHFEGRSYGF